MRASFKNRNPNRGLDTILGRTFAICFGLRQEFRGRSILFLGFRPRFFPGEVQPRFGEFGKAEPILRSIRAGDRRNYSWRKSCGQCSEDRAEAEAEAWERRRWQMGTWVCLCFLRGAPPPPPVFSGSKGKPSGKPVFWGEPPIFCEFKGKN